MQTIDVRVPLDKPYSEQLARCKEIANDILKVDLSAIDNLEDRRIARCFLIRASEEYRRALWYDGFDILLELLYFLEKKGYQKNSFDNTGKGGDTIVRDSESAG